MKIKIGKYYKHKSKHRFIKVKMVHESFSEGVGFITNELSQITIGDMEISNHGDFQEIPEEDFNKELELIVNKLDIRFR